MLKLLVVSVAARADVDMRGLPLRSSRDAAFVKPVQQPAAIRCLKPGFHRTASSILGSCPSPPLHVPSWGGDENPLSSLCRLAVSPSRQVQKVQLG